MIEDIKHWQEFFGCLAASFNRWMVVAGGIVKRVASPEDMLDLSVLDAMMRIGIGQYVIKIKDSHVVERVIIFVQLVTDQP
jgi:hypothetical protein